VTAHNTRVVSAQGKTVCIT